MCSRICYSVCIKNINLIDPLDEKYSILIHNIKNLFYLNDLL